MKKFLLIIVIIFAIIFASLAAFANSNYFFNRYIAKNIKEYGFSYTHTDGALLKGFIVEELKYKNRVLSSNVELEINPLRLFSGVVSISKINLIGVREDVLEDVLNDFKPSEDGSSSSTIPLDFELKNIVLTIKPFKIKELDITRNNLTVSYISYLNGHFNIGKVNYEAKTNLGEANFEGKYEHRVLNIDQLELENFDLKRLITILKEIKSTGSQEEYHLASNPFVPKKVIIKSATVKLVPFIYKGIETKGLLLHLKNNVFDVTDLLFKRGELSFKYSGDFVSLNTNIHYDNKILQVKKANILLLDPEKFETLINSITLINSNNESNKSLNNKIFPIEKIELIQGEFHCKSCLYRKEKIKSTNLTVTNFVFDLNRTKVSSLEDFKFDFNSSLGNIAANGSIDTVTKLNFLKIATDNADKLEKFIYKYSDNNSSSESMENKSISTLPIPEILSISHLETDVKKLIFNPYKIKHGIINARNIMIDLNKKVIQKGSMSVKTTSNWGDANLKGTIKKSNFYAKGSCAPNQVLLDRYKIPLRAKNFKRVDVKGRFSFEDLDINGTIRGKNILKTVDNLNILNSQNRLFYNYTKDKLIWSVDAKVASPYLKVAKVHNRLLYQNDTTTYSGKIKSENITFLDKKLGKLFKNINAQYSGDKENFKLNFLSSFTKGSLNIKNYDKAKVVLENRDSFYIKDFVDLPKAYQDTKLSTLKVDFPIDFRNQSSIVHGNLLVVTNLATIDNSWVYKKSNFSTKGVLKIPASSLLFKKHPLLRKKNIALFKNSLAFTKSRMLLNISNNILKAKLQYDIKDGRVISSNIGLGSLNLKVKGNLKTLDIQAKISSIKKAQNVLSKLYKSKINSNLDGTLTLKAQLEQLSKLNFLISSPQLTYSGKKSKRKIENIIIDGELKDHRVKIKKYNFLVQGYKVFSIKSSLIDINNFKDVKINPLWINDSLLVTGNYNLQALSGKLKFKSNNFNLENSDLRVKLGVDTSLSVDKEKIFASGTLTVLDGAIKKVIEQKNVAENEDIIILQRQKQRESTDFAKNIKLNIKIKSKNGIVYSHGRNKIQLLPNLSIVKEYNRLSNFNGKTKIAKNSYYYLNGKKLIVEKGDITFKGKSMSPNLNIILTYLGREYKIRINIVGTPTRPVLYFSSDPSLTKDQILAYLLFDDTSAAGTHSQAAMLNTIGGSIAKSFLGSLGIKIDYISIGKNSFSIGKSLGKNMIIYYSQENQEPSIKTRIDINKYIHTEVEVGQEKQSADIIFSKEY